MEGKIGFRGICDWGKECVVRVEVVRDNNVEGGRGFERVIKVLERCGLGLGYGGNKWGRWIGRRG